MTHSVFVVVCMCDILAMLAKIPCKFNVSVNLSPSSGPHSPGGFWRQITLVLWKKKTVEFCIMVNVLIACFLKIKLIIHVNESGFTRQFQTPYTDHKNAMIQYHTSFQSIICDRDLNQIYSNIVAAVFFLFFFISLINGFGSSFLFKLINFMP